MKVKELIELLSKVDPEIEVVKYDYDSEFGFESFDPIDPKYLPSVMKLSEKPFVVGGFRYIVKDKKSGFPRKNFFVIK